MTHVRQKLALGLARGFCTRFGFLELLRFPYELRIQPPRFTGGLRVLLP